jgi:hypothetical protein
MLNLPEARRVGVIGSLTFEQAALLFGLDGTRIRENF